MCGAFDVCRGADVAGRNCKQRPCLRSRMPGGRRCRLAAIRSGHGASGVVARPGELAPVPISRSGLARAQVGRALGWPAGWSAAGSRRAVAVGRISRMALCETAAVPAAGPPRSLCTALCRARPAPMEQRGARRAAAAASARPAGAGYGAPQARARDDVRPNAKPTSAVRPRCEHAAVHRAALADRWRRPRDRVTMRSPASRPRHRRPFP